ncbi:MAG TPA: class I SAM-dependent rRNA methyltransferase [Ignavibacteria bacterium]|nr:class I SAM-dependent rRNA methyltransferase [Ignavibacteria bacterium]HMR40362.1 class I SAM-dependent rRNA methyltransferase [Ignavibacteria bacterium]
MPQLKLKKNEERRLLSGHQWIFSNEIEFMEGEPKNGEVVELFSYSNNFLGKGFYNKNSLIAYRQLTNKDEEINKAFIFKRMSLANSLRKRIYPERNTYRLINSESDYLPGLIIDKFDNKFSFQIFSFGMNEYRDIISELLKENFKAELIVEKNNNELRTLEGLDKTEEILYSFKDPADESFKCKIDEIIYDMDLLKGQKTGFYLDQCESRVLLRKYIKPDYKVLDLFCNEGGFALNAAFAGAEDVTGVDSSEHSINTSVKNAALNKLEKINFICKDVFEHLNELFQTKERYDVIIVDPPSFAKSKKNLFPALKGYQELNYKAMRLLKPNSILCTFSCSHHVSEKHFEEMLIKSASEAKRKIQIIEFRNCTFDHPVLPQMPETKYLKGYFLRVL